MRLFNTENLVLIFHLLCLSAALSMTIYCAYEFSKNDDLSEVLHKRFNEDEEGIYPQITMCFANPYLNDKLVQYGEGINSTSYGQFLIGYSDWDDRMGQIQYENVTLDLNRYLIDICMQSTYSDKCLKINPIRYVTSTGFGTAKCFTIETNIKNKLSFLYVRIKTSIFPGGMRPDLYKFSVHFHYSHQIRKSLSTSKNQWPVRDNSSSKYYEVHFKIRSMEIVRLRNKPRKPCHDWKSYATVSCKILWKLLNVRHHIGNQITMGINHAKLRKG